MFRIVSCGEQLLRRESEKLTRLPRFPECYVLIGKPGINVSTKTARENLESEGMEYHPDIDGLIGDIRTRSDLYALACQKMGNVFEPGIIHEISCDRQYQAPDGRKKVR